LALSPDVVVMDKEENRAADATALQAAGVPVYALHVTSVADVGPALTGLAERIGGPSRQLPEPPRVRGAAAEAGTPLTAFIPIWRRPWMSINTETYGSSLLAAAGIANVFGDAKDRYPTITLGQAAARRPAIVLAPSEPYPFRERHRAELETVAPVVLVDGQDLFWWGARTSGALSRLSEAVQGWRTLPPGA
ncbi:MAG TPA: helical backbone metal receptor, partial [Acidimicrobiales bacterium]|nr:helical backbone metal receptor [Acidimicrobiales bacterium]